MREVNGKLPAYLDSAASSQKPRQVIDTIVDVYETSYAAVHRAVYALGERATERYEGARDIVAELLNARSRREVIFVRNATEGINLVAYGYGLRFLGKGDVIVSTEMEHHSNLVPWQELARRTGAELRFVRSDRPRRARSRVVRGARLGQRQARRRHPRLELARHGKQRRRDRPRGRTSTVR